MFNVQCLNVLRESKFFYFHAVKYFMKSVQLLIFFFLFSVKLFAQYTLATEVPLKADYFTSDNLGNAYTVSGHEIFKYLPSGKLFNRYSNLMLGNITSVDASNPLKILLFYKDFSKIQFLDNQLAESRGVISLQDLGLEQSTLACISFDNGFWVYDQINFSLIRFNQTFDKVQEARNINQNIGYEPQPDFLHEWGDWIYLNNPETGILVFDIFGTYFKTIPLKGLTSFQIAGENLLYFKDGKLMAYNLKTLHEGEIQVPADKIQMLRIEKEKLMILTNESLKVYQVK
ncbi:MAG: hypothetical protein POELPBGB_02473 [Bacteroidia bacterium]|nr:hypothetical protein [Bacteroidia bacterium]